MGRIPIYFVGLIVLVASIEAQRNLEYPTTPQPALQPQPTTTDAATPDATTAINAPYPAAGYRPGRAFNLPTEDFPRNLPFPTTNQPPSTPSSSEPSTTPAEIEPQPTVPEATTPGDSVNAPYPAAGYRPGRAFNLPTEERNAAEVPDSSYGPPTEEPTTSTDNAPYPPSGYRPGRAFDLPTEERVAPETSYGPPAEEAPAPYPPAGYRPGRAFILPTENEDEIRNLDEPGSGYLPPELDQSPAGTEIVTSVRFPGDYEDEDDLGFNDVEVARLTSSRGVIQTRPPGFRQPERVVDHRVLRPGSNTLQPPPPFRPNTFQPIGGPAYRPLRPAQRRPLRPVNPPIGGTQTVLQARPSFGVNSGVGFDRRPVLVTTIRLPDPFAFTSFLDGF